MKPTPKPSERVYWAMLDWWLLVMIALLLLGLALMTTQLFTFEVGIWSKILAFLGIVATMFYIADLAFFTNYILTEDSLIINNQMRKIVVPYRQIRTIRPGGFKDLFSRGKFKRFALSAKNIVISADHQVWKKFSISPKEPAKFIDRLLKYVDAERSTRVSKK